MSCRADMSATYRSNNWPAEFFLFPVLYLFSRILQRFCVTSFHRWYFPALMDDGQRKNQTRNIKMKRGCICILLSKLHTFCKLSSVWISNPIYFFLFCDVITKRNFKSMFQLYTYCSKANCSGGKTRRSWMNLKHWRLSGYCEYLEYVSSFNPLDVQAGWNWPEVRWKHAPCGVYGACLRLTNFKCRSTNTSQEKNRASNCKIRRKSSDRDFFWLLKNQKSYVSWVKIDPTVMYHRVHDIELHAHL